MSEKEKYLKSLKKELDKYTEQLSSIRQEFQEKTGGDIENITQSLQDILQEAKLAYGKLASASAAEWEPVKDITQEAFHNVRTSFEAFVNASANQIKDYTIQLEKNYHEQVAHVAKYVRQYPLKSLLIAAAAGFIIGRVLK